jgi:hypothetical protein
MSTLRRHQYDAGRVVTTAKMIFNSSQLHTLVVEGEADFRLLRNWLNDKCARLEIVNGKDNVKDVWRRAKSMKFSPLHCLADLDYDLVADYTPIIDSQFVYVSMEEGQSAQEIECNDLESVLIRSSAFTKVLAQKYQRIDFGKENFHEFVEKLRENLRTASRNIGAFRAADLCYYRVNRRSAIGSDFGITDVFFDRVTLAIDIDAVADALLRSSRLSFSAMEEVIGIARELLVKFDSGWQLCRGHDLTKLLAIYLTDRLGRNVSAREVEEDLRMACELETLYQTRFGKRLQAIGSDLGNPCRCIAKICSHSALCEPAIIMMGPTQGID